MFYVVGNPGTGKGEMLKWMPNIRHRATVIDSPSASARGLMFGQNTERGALNAGPITKFDVIGMDELPELNESIFGEMRTPIEQQVVTYTKNGYNVSRPHEFSIIGMGNPKDGAWSNTYDVLKNINMPYAFINRFIIARIIDSKESRKERAAYISKITGSGKYRDYKYSTHLMAGWITHARSIKVTIPAKMSKRLEDAYNVSAELAEQYDPSHLINSRQQLDYIRVTHAIARLLNKEVVDDICVDKAMEFMMNCQGFTWSRDRCRGKNVKLC